MVAVDFTEALVGSPFSLTAPALGAVREKSTSLFQEIHIQSICTGFGTQYSTNFCLVIIVASKQACLRAFKWIFTDNHQQPRQTTGADGPFPHVRCHVQVMPPTVCCEYINCELWLSVVNYWLVQHELELNISKTVQCFPSLTVKNLNLRHLRQCISFSCWNGDASTWAYTHRLHFQHDKDGQVWQSKDYFYLLFRLSWHPPVFCSHWSDGAHVKTWNRYLGELTWPPTPSPSPLSWSASKFRHARSAT